MTCHTPAYGELSHRSSLCNSNHFFVVYIVRAQLLAISCNTLKIPHLSSAIPLDSCYILNKPLGAIALNLNSQRLSVVVDFS